MGEQEGREGKKEGGREGKGRGFSLKPHISCLSLASVESRAWDKGSRAIFYLEI